MQVVRLPQHLPGDWGMAAVAVFRRLIKGRTWSSARRMARHVSLQRLHRALHALRAWKSAVDSQGAQHLWHFLGAKRAGANPKSFVDYGEPDELEFCREFLGIGEHVALENGKPRAFPFYDPVGGEFRIETHAHSNVSTQRKKTFADKWKAGEYQTNPERWKFNPKYDQVFVEKVLTKGGAITRVPLWDLCAWLFRMRTFPEGAGLADIKKLFADEFHMSQKEMSTFFDDGPLDQEGDFFSRVPPRRDLIVQMAATGEGFNLADALEESTKPIGDTMELEAAVQLASKGRRQVIFQGPPGCGKTFMAQLVAARLLGATPDALRDSHAAAAFMEARQFSSLKGKDYDSLASEVTKQGGTWEIVQFHPTYAYEDFVRGIATDVDARTKTTVFRVEDRIFARLATVSTKVKVPVVLIIDEVNRADISKVLGELIYALEYRGRQVALPYAVEGSRTLAVGANLVVLATMNTADRSIALVDYAIRRRFDFVDLLPDRGVLERHATARFPEAAARVLQLFDNVQRLFVDSRDYAVGHSYFMGEDVADVSRRVVFEVLPLLAEYQKENIIDDASRLEVGDDWPGNFLPLRHARPFELVTRVEEWIGGRAKATIETSAARKP